MGVECGEVEAVFLEGCRVHISFVLRIFIQWNDDWDARSSFWGRLCVALREITTNENI